MTAWTQWQTIRHQVAIAGRVVDADGLAIAGAAIEISSSSARFERRVEGAVSAAEASQPASRRFGRTVTGSDGLYYFMDLPDGRYSVRAVHPKSGKHVQKTASVARDAEEKITMVKADLKFG